MKVLLIALALVSGSAFAQRMDATEALTSIIPLGTYSGSFQGERCKVTVEPIANGVMVVASNSKYSRRRYVERGSVYNIGAGFYFRSSTSYGTNDGFNENLVMTRADKSPGKQYVVVADRVVVMNDQFEYPIECIITLN